ncbi:acyltransferase [Janibacter sp. GS2]|uniref:acyltransferase n=1 Tax=Janibacter sp. GS2 TaxID=3442646 RepID=UPI003EB75248
MEPHDDHTRLLGRAWRMGNGQPNGTMRSYPEEGRDMRLGRFACRVLYMLVARRLPRSNVPWALGSGRLRTLLVRGFATGYVHPTVNIEHGAEITTSEITVGSHSGIGVNCWIQGPLFIGDDVMMGPECRIYTRNHASSDLSLPMRKQGFEPPEAVIIEDDVWLGARSMIMPGTRVARGSIVAAASVVTKDVPPFSVVAGTPARIVRNRRGPETRTEDFPT